MRGIAPEFLDEVNMITDFELFDRVVVGRTCTGGTKAEIPRIQREAARMDEIAEKLYACMSPGKSSRKS